MTASDFQRLVSEMRKRQDEALALKGADYTRSDPNRLTNFNRRASDTGLTPLQVWAVYAGKHLDAIMALVTTGKLESEAIESRFIDLQNYLYLGMAIILEGVVETSEKPPPVWVDILDDVNESK